MVAAPSGDRKWHQSFVGPIMNPEQITLILFTLFNIIRILGYLPQLALSLRDTSGGASTSIATWVMFCAANTSAAAYAHINAGDALMATLFGANALCCLAIAAVTFGKRRLLGAEARPAVAAIETVALETPAEATPTPALPAAAQPAITARRRRLQVMTGVAPSLT
jgi:hypothetical protein